MSFWNLQNVDDLVLKSTAFGDWGERDVMLVYHQGRP